MNEASGTNNKYLNLGGLKRKIANELLKLTANFLQEKR